MKMMFRSAHADEESGSDWDDYSPAPTPQPPEAPIASGSPHKPLPKPPIATTAAPGNKHSTHKTPPFGGARFHVTDHQSSSTSRSHTDHEIKPLENELTQLATVSPPHTPVTSSPQTYTTPAAVYRVEGEDPTNNINIASSDCDQLLQQQQHCGVDAMKFSHVNDNTAMILIPSYDLPYSYMGSVADKSEQYSKRCAEEVFSSLRVVSDFIIAFLLGCCHYLINNVTRKVCCGLAHICTDSLFKPMVQVCFNGVLWPVQSMCSRVSQGCVVVLSPLLELVRALITMLTNLVAAFRPVQVNIQHKYKSNV